MVSVGCGWRWEPSLGAGPSVASLVVTSRAGLLAPCEAMCEHVK